jgi:phosphoenolpyruvate synthase/pyruvate phosphate dikinase
MVQENYICGRDELGLRDIPLVGGKTASLDELFTALVPKGINVPDGFAVTSAAYREAVEQGGWRDKLAGLMRGLNRASVGPIAARAKAAENGLEIYVMCEIPNNVIGIDAFSELFDGFSIGSNDLTQLTLGVDRDSETVAFDFDGRDPGMTEMLRLAIEGAHRNRRHVGICGEAPATYSEVAQRLVAQGIDSISVNPASLVQTFRIVAAAEAMARPAKAALG